jgi:hypothetical protein
MNRRDSIPLRPEDLSLGSFGARKDSQEIN